MWTAHFLICLIAYVLTGLVIGSLSWRVWYEDEDTGTASFILFPYSHVMNEIGETAVVETIARRFSPDTGRRVYVALVTAIWPIKLAWNAVVIALLGAIYAIAKAGQAVITLHVRRRLRSLPAAAPFARDDDEERERLTEPSSSDIEPEAELARLHEERKRISRRIRDLQLLLTKKHGSGKFRVAKRNEEN